MTAMKNSYTELLELTKKMLTHGQQDEWEALADCEKEREKIIGEITEKPLAENAADSELLKEIIGLNEEVLVLSKANQEQYSQALLALKRNSKKTSFYQK
jgi:flagellar motility protein MotE (MotC chaperone)